MDSKRRVNRPESVRTSDVPDGSFYSYFFLFFTASFIRARYENSDVSAGVKRAAESHRS